MRQAHQGELKPSYHCIDRLKPQMTYRDAVDEDESDDDFPADAGSDEEEYEEVVCIIHMSITSILKTNFYSILTQRMPTPWMCFYRPMQRRDGP